MDSGGTPGSYSKQLGQPIYIQIIHPSSFIWQYEHGFVTMTTMMFPSSVDLFLSQLINSSHAHVNKPLVANAELKM